MLAALAVCAPARADKLIWIPTANISKLSAEYMRDGVWDFELITAQLGFRNFELLGRHYSGFPGSGDSTEVGGQLQILPEGFATPGLSLGVWDVAADTPRGRRVFLVVSKSVPVVNWLPLWVKDIKFHGGLGTGSLSGVFAGAQASIPLGLTLSAEFDSSRTNFGLWWSPIKPLRLKAESWGGDFTVGAQFVSPL
jgi:hypothetical protein